jgi:hypothetical protein
MADSLRNNTGWTPHTTKIEAKYVYHYKAIGDEEAATTNYVLSHKKEKKSIQQQQTVNGGFSVFLVFKSNFTVF